MARTLRTVLSIDARKFASGLKKARLGIKRFSRSIGKPLGVAIAKFTRLATVAALAGLAIAGIGLRISGEMEYAKTRLDAVSTGAEDFKRTWENVYKLFLYSPLELEPLIEAQTLMKSFSIDSKEGMEAIGSTAVIMGKDVRDVALAVGSMRSISLRKLGIEANKVGEQFTFQFRDKAGESFKVLASGIEQARKKVLEIMNVKYGGSLEKMAKQWHGAMSTFRGVRKQSIADLFEPLKQKALPYLLKVNSVLISMIEDGTLKMWGAKFANAAFRIIKSISKIFIATKNFVRNNTSLCKKAGATFALLAISFKTGLFMPLMKLAVMLTAGLVQSFFSPVGALFAGLALAFTMFKLGDAIQQSLNFDNIFAKVLIKAEMFGKRLGLSLLPGSKGVKQELSDKYDAEEKARLKMLDGIPDEARGIGEIFISDFADAVASGKDKVSDALKNLIPDEFKNMKGFKELFAQYNNKDTFVSGDTIQNGGRGGAFDLTGRSSQWGKIWNGNPAHKMTTPADTKQESILRRQLKVSEKQYVTMAQIAKAMEGPGLNFGT
jgi:hypothetical protein